MCNKRDCLTEIDLQHNLCTLLLAGKSHLAPIDQPKQVLDVGTGTGIWAIEFGKIPSLPQASLLTPLGS